MVAASQEPIFSTPNTALAAWLYSQGFDLLEIDNTNFPTVFHFEDSSKALHSAVRDFQVGRAEGDIVAFYRAYKVLLDKIKGSQ